MIRGFMNMDISSILATLIAVIAAMSIHEMAHALVSWWLGDPTAKMRGRLSLNPFAHIDWMGVLCLFFFGFGWAKPVPIDTRYYKDEKAGIIWTSFAGPFANVLLAFVCVILYYGLFKLFPTFALSNVLGTFLMNVFSTTAAMNIGFAVFNLIPIPPLDGAKIFWAFLPDDLYYKYMRPQPWMQALLLVLVFSGLLSVPLGICRSTLMNWMSDAAMFIWGIH